MSHSSDVFIVPWRANGTPTASWDPRDGPMRASVPGTGSLVGGGTPLVIDGSWLTAGERSVQHEPAGVAHPPIDGFRGTDGDARASMSPTARPRHQQRSETT